MQLLLCTVRYLNQLQFTQPDLLLISNGTLPAEEFPVTSKSNPRKLNMNSLANRERQFQAFIEHCDSDGIKYEFIDVHLSHKDDRSLETNEQVKRIGYQKAFQDFADKAQAPTHRHHRAYQLMKRIDHTQGGARSKYGGEQMVSVEDLRRSAAFTYFAVFLFGHFVSDR